MMRRQPSVRIIAGAALAASVAVGGLVATAGPSSAARTPSGSARDGKPTVPPPFYLSLGDSYSIGYQPGFPGGGGSPGYTAYVAKKEKLTLENFGCGGATTDSILYGMGGTAGSPVVGCGDPAATGAVPYPTQTQEAAALSFIADPANTGRVALVTVSIGGNDVTACAADPTTALACVADAVTAITTNVTQLVGDVRTALDDNGDSTARIVGLTYPDVLLGASVYPASAPDPTLADESVLAFDDDINPALSTAYTSVANGSFVNVTSAPYKAATSGDDSLGKNYPAIKLKPYGFVSPATWEVCKLTYFCSQGNIHADTAGYTFIGKLIYSSLLAG